MKRPAHAHRPRPGHANLGPLRANSPTPYVIERHMHFDMPDRIANGTTTGTYVPPPAPPQRPGSDDHRKFRSRGFGC